MSEIHRQIGMYMEDTAKTRIVNHIRQLDDAALISNGCISERINIAELSRECGVSRQRVWQVLERIKETRHKRATKISNACLYCGTPISRYATNCKRHAKPFEEKKEGGWYTCRICKERKPLEQFSKNKRLKSGYENRCLVCRAAWQRDYARSSMWKNTKNHSKTFLSKHPERTRAYYQINKALKKGVLVKPAVCEKADCSQTRLSAIHRDYSDPLNVVWLCKLHSKRMDIEVKEYRPNLFEEDFRSFVFWRVQHYNSPGRWLAAIKKHYKVTNLSASLFRTAYEEHENIDGLGPRFTKTAGVYLHERGL
jgi:hypothetical protein